MLNMWWLFKRKAPTRFVDSNMKPYLQFIADSSVWTG